MSDDEAWPTAVVEGVAERLWKVLAADITSNEPWADLCAKADGGNASAARIQTATRAMANYLLDAVMKVALALKPDTADLLGTAKVPKAH